MSIGDAQDVIISRILFVHGAEFGISFNFDDKGVDIVAKEPLSSQQIHGEREN